jgi:hypothetical protein
MFELLQLIGEHKKIFVIALILLILFIAGSVLSFVSNLPKVETAPVATEEKSGQTGRESIETTETVALTTNQKDAIAKYSDSTKEVIEFLKAYTWVAQDEQSTLHFSDSSYTTTSPANTETRPYAVAAISDASRSGDEVTWEGSILALDTGNQISIIRIERWIAGTEKGEWVLGGLPGKVQIGYKATSLAHEVEVAGLDDELSALFGSQAALQNEIADYIKQYYPTATKAEWQHVVEIDAKEQVVKTMFLLNSKSSPRITATYLRDSKTIEIEGAQ